MNTKKIFFAHSAGSQSGTGQGSFDFVAYLNKEFRSEFEIHCPIIKKPEAPTYEMWKNLFAVEFNKLEQAIILIGHSLGGSMLLKYIAEEKPSISIAGLYLVATPQWGESGWDVEEFELQENFESELGEIGPIFLNHSEEDTVVPLTHLDFYKKAFPNATVRIIEGTDHAFMNGLPRLVDDLSN